jgi:hypothetical protein
MPLTLRRCGVGVGGVKNAGNSGNPILRDLSCVFREPLQKSAKLYCDNRISQPALQMTVRPLYANDLAILRREGFSHLNVVRSFTLKKRSRLSSL